MASANDEGTTNGVGRDLKLRVQALPQELQDYILGYVLAPPCDVVHIREVYKPYKPPPQLSIDFHTRRTASEEYYSNNTFVIVNESLDLPSHPRIVATTQKWLSSLSVRNFRLISRLRCDFRQKAQDGLYRSRWKMEIKRAQIAMLEDAREWLATVARWGEVNKGLSHGVVCARCSCQNVDGTWEEILLHDAKDVEDALQASRDTWVPGEPWDD